MRDHLLPLLPSMGRFQRLGRAGFSLVELLVASMLTLLIMGAVATLFSEFGKSVSDGRSLSDLSARTRSVAWRLRQDLAGLTCVPAPLVRLDSNSGYFSTNRTNCLQPSGGNFTTANFTSTNGTILIGGNYTDTVATPPAFATILQTDFLALTTSRFDPPFRGRLEGAQGLESPTAEVVWFSMPTGVSKNNRQLFDLYRRQILVSMAPDAGVFAENIFANPGQSDLSWRTFAGGTVLNSLADLSNPANRLVAQRQDTWLLSGDRRGQDVMLTNVLSFDVKFVPQAISAWVPAFPPAPNPPLTATDGAFETSVTGNATHSPLRAVEITIVCLEINTNEERVIEVVHSFGQDRHLISEPP